MIKAYSIIGSKDEQANYCYPFGLQKVHSIHVMGQCQAGVIPVNNPECRSRSKTLKNNLDFFNHIRFKLLVNFTKELELLEGVPLI